MITDIQQRVAEIQQMASPQPVAAATTGGAAAPSATTSTAAAQTFQQALTQATAAVASPATTVATGPTYDGVTAAATVAPAATTGGAAAPYEAEIQAAAATQGVDANLLRSLVEHESGFDANAQSAAGAQGLTQLMPSTAASLGVTNPFDPQQSLQAGAAYLRQQLDTFGGDPALALAAYNAGPGAVQAAGGVPNYAETQQYVASVLADAGNGDTW